MSFTAQCPVCSAVLSLESHHLGKKVRCKKCRGVFSVDREPESEIVSAPASTVCTNPPFSSGPVEPLTLVVFPCPHCQKPLEVDVALAGRREVCEHCDGAIKIPERKHFEDPRGALTRPLPAWVGALVGAVIGVPLVLLALAGSGSSSQGGSGGTTLLLVGIFILLLGVGSSLSRKSLVKKCPACAELIRVAAKVCKHCHRPVPYTSRG